MYKPLVSVVIATYNREQFLNFAVDSILAQTLQDFELLIVDDASTDGTADLLAERALNDKRIRILRTNANSGCNIARNLAFKHVRGKYVLLLDDDDVAMPGRMEKTVARLDAEPALGVVCSHYRVIDGSGCLRSWIPKFISIEDIPTPGEQVFELLYCDWAWIPTSTLTLRTELLRHHAYPNIRRSDGDSIFHCQMAAVGTFFAQLKEPLALVRRDDTYDSMSCDRVRLFAARRQSLALLRLWLADHGITKYNHLHKIALSNQLVKEAQFFRGFRGFARGILALAYSPYNRRVYSYLRNQLFAVPFKRMKRLLHVGGMKKSRP